MTKSFSAKFFQICKIMKQEMNTPSNNISTLLFTLFAGLFLVASFISYNKIKQLEKSVDWVMYSQVVKDNIVELSSNIKDAETGIRGYLITNDSGFLLPFIGAEQRSNLVFVTLDSLINDNAGQQENLKNLKTLLDERYLMLNEQINLYKNNPSINLLADSFALRPIAGRRAARVPAVLVQPCLQIYNP